MIIGKYKKTNKNVNIDIEELIDSRLLIQANSGGGKSYLLRKILEASNNKVQQIVLDLEGEFSTLREKYDYLLIGKEGDIPINIKSAELLAYKILELGTSAIIDLYELKKHERIIFVKRFLDSMIDAPKRLWHPVLVVVDEAHIFCPESTKSESASSVIDLCTRGRKRGFCALLATQRLSKLNKDAAAECNNKLLGRTGLDVDRKRVSDELGFTSKEQNLSLRNLKAGEFYVFGTAISDKVEIIKVGEVETTHPKRGERILKKVTPPTEKIKSLLKKLTDLPKEAEKELKSKDDFTKEIHRLKIELRKRNIHIDPKQLEREYQRGVRETELQYLKRTKEIEVNIKKQELNYKKQQSDLIRFNQTLQKEFQHFVAKYSKLLQIEVPKFEFAKPTMPMGLLKSGIISDIKPILPKVSPMVSPDVSPKVINDDSDNDEIKLFPSYTRMLKAVAMFNPDIVSKPKISMLSNVPQKTSTFKNGISRLKSESLIIPKGDGFSITERGLEIAGDVEQLPTDTDELIKMWSSKMFPSYQRMFLVVTQAYPNYISKEEISELSQVPRDTSTFKNGFSKLKVLGLIKVKGNEIKASEELFE